jgi:catechol 2,3-dioxygenase-like lactoylglutathione lyase family enzyme
MELGHIALTVTDHNEIQGFYHEVLGMKEIRSFSLDKHLVRHIFGIEETTTVVQLQKDGLLLELFITPEPCDHPYRHVCISTAHREENCKEGHATFIQVCSHKKTKIRYDIYFGS